MTVRPLLTSRDHPSRALLEAEVADVLLLCSSERVAAQLQLLAAGDVPPVSALLDALPVRQEAERAGVREAT